MVPILYDAETKDFNNNGIGILRDAISCEVTEERNGLFEAELVYPADGFLFSEIKGQSIMKIKANNVQDPQLFRVYKIGKPIDGIVTFNLEHISYINQDSGLFEDSIINNIVLNNEIDNNKLDEIIKILNLDEVIKNKERGINTLIKDNFSGGEKQKIIIARCLYKCSDIMVFDEAFSEISSNDRINIINKINDVYRDKTIIYVNHFNDYIKYDQILEIKSTRKDKVDE